MVIDIFLILIIWFLQLINYLLPNFSIWPTSLLIGITYLANAVMSFNFIFPIDKLFEVISFLIIFFSYFLSAKIIFMIINYIRGTDSIDI